MSHTQQAFSNRAALYRSAFQAKRLEVIDLVERLGLPLEIVSFQGTRVISIVSIDYCEGAQKPLVTRAVSWGRVTRDSYIGLVVGADGQPHWELP